VGFQPLELDCVLATGSVTDAQLLEVDKVYLEFRHHVRVLDKRFVQLLDQLVHLTHARPFAAHALVQAVQALDVDGHAEHGEVAARGTCAVKELNGCPVAEAHLEREDKLGRVGEVRVLVEVGDRVGGEEVVLEELLADVAGDNEVPEFAACAGEACVEFGLAEDGEGGHGEHGRVLLVVLGDRLVFVEGVGEGEERQGVFDVEDLVEEGADQAAVVG